MSGLMSRPTVNLLPLLLVFAVPLCLPATSFADDVSGSWDLTVETRQGTDTPSVTLKQDGEKLSGTYHGRMGDTALQGTLRGNNIQFSVRLKFRDQYFVVTYTGTVDGASMKGTVQFGESSSGTWSARRKSGSG